MKGLHPPLLAKHMQNSLLSIYDDRDSNCLIDYSRFNPANLYSQQERLLYLVRLLKSAGLDRLSGLKVLDFGCGFGLHLLDFISLGADPGSLYGCDLSSHRISQSMRILPKECTLCTTSDSRLPDHWTDFNLIYASTVFSSILQNEERSRTAKLLCERLNQHGLLVIYDFIFDNPFNKNVRSFTLSDIHKYFPGYQAKSVRLTLNPWIARRVASQASALPVLSSLSFLKSHRLTILRRL